MLNKIQLNTAQTQLAKGWLPPDSHPYSYSRIGMLWYWQSTKAGPVKNGLRLDSNQLRQLEQLAD